MYRSRTITVFVRSRSARPFGARESEGLSVATLHVRCLGSFAFRGTDTWSSGPAFKRGRELLEYFAAYAEHAVPRDTLVEAFWPNFDGPSAAHRLHIAVSGARAALRVVVPCSDPIRARAGRYLWDPVLDVRSDLKHFLDLASQKTVAAMRAGVAMYAGEFLAGEDADWIYPLRVRCASAYATMLEGLAGDASRRNDHADALDYALRLAEVDRAHEGAARIAMQALAALGRRGAALAEYDQLAKYLDRHLGIAPSAATQDVRSAVVAG
jgi:DNA-binding SARP family transcriptional activator